MKRYISIPRSIRRTLRSRRTWLTVAVVAAVFGLANAAVFAAHLGKTYSNTTVGGQKFGSISSSDLDGKLRQLELLPDSVSFEQGTIKVSAGTGELGVSVDYDALKDRTMDTRAWLPIANLWTKHDVATKFTTDDAKLQDTLTKALNSFNKQPVDARIEPTNGNFAITPESKGQNVDNQATKKALLSALGAGRQSSTVVTTATNPKVSSKALSSQLQALLTQSKTGISFTYNGQTKRLSTADITTLYAADGNTMAISDSAILTSVAAAGSAWGIVVQDQAQVVATVRKALEQQKDTTITLVAAPVAAKTITYCSSVRGVSESELPTLNAKLQSTLADSRGWGLGGLVRFVKSDAGCQMHFWLTAADQMPSFGAICDSMWSCAVHPNVVINYDRWRFASEAWNAQGGNLEDYRAMVINHESGHWFGYYHAECPGPGQAAPVMQQQSINLQGCTFNPWPTSSEQASLKRSLGI